MSIAPNAPVVGSFASTMSAPPSTAAVASAAFATLTSSCISFLTALELARTLNTLHTPSSFIAHVARA
jgi:hypothetical protein